jgi:hypothetical protein
VNNYRPFCKKVCDSLVNIAPLRGRSYRLASEQRTP